MNATFKKVDLVKINNLLHQLNKSSTQFSFFASYNINKLKPFIEAFNETSKTKVEGFEAFAEERNKILASHSEKNSDGSIKNIDGVPAVIESEKEVLIGKLKAFDSENKASIEAREVELKEMNNFLEEDIEFDLAKVGYKILPELNKDQFGILRQLIKETDEELLEML